MATFYVRGWLSDHILGTIKLVPLEEALQNDPKRVLHLLKRRQNNGSVLSDEPSEELHPDSVLDADNEMNNEPADGELAEEERAQLEQLTDGGLLFSFTDHPDDPAEIEEELLLIGNVLNC